MGTNGRMGAAEKDSPLYPFCNPAVLPPFLLVSQLKEELLRRQVKMIAGLGVVVPKSNLQHPAPHIHVLLVGENIDGNSCIAVERHCTVLIHWLNTMIVGKSRNALIHSVGILIGQIFIGCYCCSQPPFVRRGNFSRLNNQHVGCRRRLRLDIGKLFSNRSDLLFHRGLRQVSLLLLESGTNRSSHLFLCQQRLHRLLFFQFRDNRIRIGFMRLRQQLGGLPDWRDR